MRSLPIIRGVPRADEGQAIVAGVAISFVLAVVIGSLLALAVRSDNATTRDRSRTQGIQSAEAGVSHVLDQLRGSSPCVQDIGFGASGPQTVLSGKKVGQYQAVVRLPANAGQRTLPSGAWNPNSASCTTLPAGQQNVVVTAWGYGPSQDSNNKELRRLDVTVRLTPLTGFRYTCFSGGSTPSQTLSTTNNFIVQGDCYTAQAPIFGGNPNTDFTGTFTTPESFTSPNVPSWTLSGSVVAGKAVHLRDGHVVSGSLTSATSSVTLGSNAKVLKDVMAGTAINMGSGATISGSRCPATATSPGCPSAPPTVLSLPTLYCAATNFSCWQQRFPGMQVMTAAALSTHLKTTHRNNLQGSFYVSDGATNALDLQWGGGSSATVTGPLTVISPGKINLSGTLQTPSAGVPNACTSGGASTCHVSFVSLVSNTSSVGIEVFTPRFTASDTISMLLYTTGTLAATSGGTNPFSYRGVMYATHLDLRSNGMSFQRSQDLIDFPPPIVDWYNSASAGYVAQPLSWRESPPTPPV
ncbi:MAG TPA: hypothetical protein VM840_04075 [Actinomycetota bacterium]|nr:hypothetical protein [Actinomycetota bacterium]